MLDLRVGPGLQLPPGVDVSRMPWVSTDSPPDCMFDVTIG
jgi:hypothetical protein